MIRKIYLLISVILSLLANCQTVKISGSVNDTSRKQPLSNALLIAIKFTDSSLVNYTRTGKDGIFKTIVIPADTYIVIISHPEFSDKTYLLVPNKNDSVFKFKNVVLPPKSFDLNEVEVIAYKDKMYYKGDTLQFTADSFKTRPNATVEDLLKKLPGVRVDAKGKITIQGKQVDQVLVDGDEFFGTDPTVATRNLNANTVETVQVYEKKNESSDNGDETVKIVNLKLKEEAKRGYFGKVSTAGGSNMPLKTGQRFYEEELLLNRFKKNRKISFFGLAANTPKQAFSWQDADKYGLDNEYGSNYDPETNSWTSSNNGTGIPKTLKTGFYFNDKFGKNTKINTDYTFKQNQLNTGTETNTQFILQDTTYTNKQIISSSSFSQSHNFSLKLTQKLDSLTELTFRPKVSYSTSGTTNSQNDEFISKIGDLQRQTSILNKGSIETIDANAQVFLKRNYLKKDRLLTIVYQPSYYNSSSGNDLNTDFRYYKNQLPDSSIKQKRSSLNHREEHNASLTFTEPLSKKIKTEISYSFVENLNSNNRSTLDFNGQAYDIVNAAQSNNFKNTRIVNRGGAKLIYDVKKYRFSIGSYVRNVYQQNINLSKDQTLYQNITNFLPVASANFRINQGSNLTIFYTSSAQQADLQKMQPVADNSDPNRIRIGNPDLKTQLTNNVRLNYYFYRGIRDINFYAGATANSVSNEFNDKTTFDALGRSVTMPVNINGNYNSSAWIGGGFPLFKRFLKVYYGFNGSYNNNVGFVNDLKNTTRTMGLYPNVNFEKQLDFLDISIGGEYQYNSTKQTINLSSVQPYYTYKLNGRLMLKLPKNFRLTANGDYNNNGNRASGYNLNYFILDASFSKTFFKTENLILAAEANDILNQNISNQRQITANKITDTKTQIIKQYFLMRVTYKFNSQKTKETEDDN